MCSLNLQSWILTETGSAGRVQFKLTVMDSYRDSCFWKLQEVNKGMQKMNAKSPRKAAGKGKAQANGAGCSKGAAAEGSGDAGGEAQANGAGSSRGAAAEGCGDAGGEAQANGAGKEEAAPVQEAAAPAANGSGGSPSKGKRGRQSQPKAKKGVAAAEEEQTAKKPCQRKGN